jgi:hypothetical protein
VDSEACWHVVGPFTFGVEYAQQLQVLTSEALSHGKGNVLVAGGFRRTEFNVVLIGAWCTKLRAYVASTDFEKH